MEEEEGEDEEEGYTEMHGSLLRLLVWFDSMVEGGMNVTWLGR